MYPSVVNFGRTLEIEGRKSNFPSENADFSQVVVGGQNTPG